MGRQLNMPRWFAMSPEKAFWLFAIFAVIVFLAGGGSRYDIESVGPLRAFAAIVLAIAVYWQTAHSVQRISRPLAILLALAAIMIVQLIPLPPSIWHGLPWRETIVQIDQALGLDDVWRPITLSPLKTANSLASLVVPLAALMLLGLLDSKGWARVRKLIIFAGLASALLGIAQLTLRGSPGLYLYEITNEGSAVGLFSNRNHNALLLNIALLFTLFENWSVARRKGASLDLFLVAAQGVLLLAILINSSRFGLVLLAFVAIVFALRTWKRRDHKASDPRTAKLRRIYGIGFGLAAVILVSLFAATSRLPALERLFTQSFDQEQRSSTLPYVLQLLTDHFPFGVGFGAFEQAYRMIEPVDLLGPRYLNHAHNDWLQVFIEGGAAIAVVMLVAASLVVRRILSLWKAHKQGSLRSTAPLLGGLTLVMIAMHSLVDYPLRTPSIMLVAAVAVVMLFRHRLNDADPHGDGGQ